MAASSAIQTETEAHFAEAPRRQARPLLLLLALVLALHLPFLNRGVQSDEVNYLDLAENALHRPLAPNDMLYVFQGRWVDMAGHPHPPLNAYLLAALLKLRGGFSEPFFHAAYLIFPLLTAAAMYFLAARFTRRAWLAATLLATAPVVQVFSHTLESDSPTLALGVSGMALFIYGVDRRDRRRLWAGAALLSLAAMGALQALFLVPIAALYAWSYGPESRHGRISGLAAAALPAAVLGAWQLLQAALIGRIPAAVLGGYILSYGFLAAVYKLRNAVALAQHAATLAVFLPVLVAAFWRAVPRGAAVAAVALAGIGAWRLEGYRGFERVLFVVCFSSGLLLLAALARLLFEREDRDTRFLTAWFLLYFAACLAAFYAGAARYLLLGLPALVILAVRRLDAWQQPRRRLAAAVALSGNLLLGLALAHADYQWAGIHRSFAQDARKLVRANERFLFNGEWGFRYYMSRMGGEILWKGTTGRPGEYLLVSRLALGADYQSPAEDTAVPVGMHRLLAATPLRLIDLGGDDPKQPAARAGFLSAGFGLLPFSFSTGPLDEIYVLRISPLLDLLGRARVEPAGAEALLTHIEFPQGRRVVLRQTPGSTVTLPAPRTWRRLQGALFARGGGSALFTISAGSGLVFLQRVNLQRGDAWTPFRVELPVRPAGEPLLLRIEAPRDMLVGWGGVLAD